MNLNAYKIKTLFFKIPKSVVKNAFLIPNMHLISIIHSLKKYLKKKSLKNQESQ